MRIEDAGPEGARTEKARRKTRLDSVKEVLGPLGKADPAAKPGLLEELSDACPVRLFRFSDRAEWVDTVQEITGTGERTNLWAALKVPSEELRGRPVVAVVLLTDGADNVGGSATELAAELGARSIPVFCVGFGDPNPPRDYEVLRVLAPLEVHTNTSAQVHATVRATGYDKPFEVILRRDKQVLESVQVTPQAGTEVQPVTFSLRPEEKGTFRYTVEIPAAEDEVIVDNNRHEFLVTVTDRRLPVLYLEGSPREEYRFLRRALFRDKDFRIASILRIEGPRKYLLQGAEPEDGLEKAPESGSAAAKGVNGFPKSREHLYRFEAVILGDIEAKYLTPEQLAMIEEFVREGGGGLLMLGGVNSFNLGNYQGTVIEKMLPVVLPKPDVEYQHREFTIVLSKVGEKHPIMQQTDNVLVNRNIWSKAATLIGFNPMDEVKPGAEVLATEARSGNPVLVVQNYGRGRVAAFMTGGSWHWQMARPVEDELHEKFWKQLVRWIAARSRGKITVELNKDLFAAKEPVVVRTTVLDKVHKPVNNAKVVATIKDPFAHTRDVPQDWILSEEGVYEARYEPIDVGDYQVDVSATLPDGEKLTAAANFSVGETLTEFNDAGQKVALLQEIARQSGGKYVTGGQVKDVVEDVRDLVRKMKRQETVYVTRDIWDTPLLFALLALALSAEWLIRRRSGLM
jgi:uncharacterized membrane protein